MYRRLSIILLVCWILSACAGTPPTSTTGLSENPAPTLLSASVSVDGLLAQMTLEEKIGQMTQVEMNSITPEDINKYFIGSIISGGGEVPTITDVENWAASFNPPAAPKTRLRIPLIYGVDAVHGVGALYGATVFPHQIGLGAANNPSLVRQIGQATAEEMRAVGVMWNFAPVVAIPQDIRWGRTYESYSENPERVIDLSTAFMQGLQTMPDGYAGAGGQTLYTLATPKHFLGDGGTTFGTSTQNIFKPYLIDQGDMQYDEAAVRELFLPAYKAAIQGGAKSIMVSFSSWNGTKMHASKYWITDVLKGELAFDCFVVSDWGGIDQIDSDYYTSVVTAINAGVDMNMVPYDYKLYIKTMKAAVKLGDISTERIDDAVRRILTVKFELGLFDTVGSNSSSLEVVGSESHRTLARQAVRESLVLLKNENEALPIAEDTPLIYVAGKAANDMGIQCGGWTTEWQGEMGDVQRGTTILAGIQAAVLTGSQVVYDIEGQFSGTADIGIAVIGEEPYAEGVGDANDLSLSQKDRQVIDHLRAQSKKLLVIIVSGRPMVITPQYQTADAWVAAWLPGTEGSGLSDVLFGDYPFVGTLPYTWPRFNDQLPLNIHNVENLTGCSAPLFLYGYGLDEGGSQPVEWLDCP